MSEKLSGVNNGNGRYVICIYIYYYIDTEKYR